MTVRMLCTRYDDEWACLKSYDPEAYGGRGRVTFTQDIRRSVDVSRQAGGVGLVLCAP
jgi:hypothetical protein